MKAVIEEFPPLTEGDCFMLALEKKHMQETGGSNNACRYVLTVAGYIDPEHFKAKINANGDLMWLSSLVPEKRYPLSLPQWRKSETVAPVPVWVHRGEEFLPEHILQRKIYVGKPPALTFDLIYRANGDTSILFSWHHLVMDGHGAVLLLKQLAGDLTATSPFLYVKDKRDTLGLSAFWQAVRAKFFVDRVSKKPLGGIMDLDRPTTSTQRVKILRFSKEATSRMDELALGLGAQFGRSPFYLACAARCVSAVLKKNKTERHDLWIPVPRNQRRKGAKGPVLGNHISFLFFRIKTSEIDSLSACVKSINEQTKKQMRSGMTKAYDMLTRFLRRTPLPLYYFWIKGPKGGSLSSFLFTVAADHPTDLRTFGGHVVKEALSLPSNISPPGLTFAYMHHQGTLQLMILFFDGLLKEDEVTEMEKQLRHELTMGTHYRDGVL